MLQDFKHTLKIPFNKIERHIHNMKKKKAFDPIFPEVMLYMKI